MFLTLFAVPELMSLSVIVQTVKGHLEDLVGLTQAVPGSVVSLVHFDSVPEIYSQQQEPREKRPVDVMSSLVTTLQQLEPDL